MSIIFFALGFACGVSVLLLTAILYSRKKTMLFNEQANSLLKERNEIGRQQLHELERIACATENRL